MRTHTTSQEAVEMYLKTVAELSRQQSPVPVARIAGRLGVTAVSANEMMKRLVEQNYVNHIPYKGITLTAAGQSIAHSLMRRQRLWECFLVDELNLSWAGVYEAACRLEHATSNVVAEALAAYLNHPQHCPHGNVIPSATGEVYLEESYALSAVPVGKTVRILSIQPTTTDIYAHLQRRGLLPGQEFTIVEAAPLDGPLTLRGQTGTIAVGLAVAELIDVAVLTAKEGKGETAVTTSLDQLKPGEKAIITRVGGHNGIRRRFMEMGMVRGETVRAERVAPLGDPIAYRIKGYSLSLRKEEAQNIQVERIA